MGERFDLTRWNRAGLGRFAYVDGNAATFLEDLRRRLAVPFPEWTSVKDAPAGEDDPVARLRDIVAQYQGAAKDDVLWALSRTFARACHVLGGYMDAYANESYLGTATQWESARRLVSMLDYTPRPPASAYTSLSVLAKAAGTVPAALQSKYTPADGSAPVVFETFEDLDVDPALNTLRPHLWNRNPTKLSGAVLRLDRVIEGLKTGEPIALEEEAQGLLSAHVVVGVAQDDTGSILTVAPPLPAAFVTGNTMVHAKPQDRLAPRRPRAASHPIGRSLQLTGPAQDLQPGEVVVLSTPGKRRRYRRIEYVEETRIKLTAPVGVLDLVNTNIARPVHLAVAQHGRRTDGAGGMITLTVYAAGDWTRLVDDWIADHHYDATSDRRFLVALRVIHAKYVPPGTDPTALQPDDRAGFTALTMRWTPGDDDVGDTGDTGLSHPPALKNLQSLLVPPVGAGPWAPDSHIDQSAGHLPATLVTSQPKKAAAGDMAVMVRGSHLAWARLRSLSVDLQQEEASLRAEGGWQTVGSGLFYLTRTTVYTAFKEKVRIAGWEENQTPLSGVAVPVATLPAALKVGRVLLVTSGGQTIKTSVLELEAGVAPPVIHLADPVPPGATRGGLTIAANVVQAGHGETVPTRVLGSGNASLLNQAFVLDIKAVSFVPDATQDSGVRAALAVTIDGETWAQVSHLRDSGPTDAHYVVRMTEEGFVQIGSGDGSHGRRMPSGANNVRVTARKGVGTAGNIPAHSLQKPVKPHPLVAALEQPLPAAGGADREEVESLRTSAPATVLTLERAVSLTDFGLLVGRHSSVWQARAFRLRTGLGRRENLEVVVVPAGGAVLSDELRDTLLAFAEAGAPPGVTITISRYEPVVIQLQVLLRIRTSAFDPEEVKAAVRARLEEAFSLRARRLGAPLYRGELFGVVEPVAGVESSDCRIIFDETTLPLGSRPRVVRGPDGTVRALFPLERQSAHLDLTDPVIDLTVEEYAP